MRPITAEIALRLKGKTYRQLAAELGCSAGYLNRVAKGKREPGDDLLTALGLERIESVTYRRKRSTNGNQASRPAA